ncbi:hypothetical protein [Halobaculum sp. P14]|uniref:hypothetical protein n=1 Tax=Halobaculum sp. P14 TaxID=3421638 RepID=UPI003EC0111B
MYEERLGTDWTDISPDEAIRRAYALGVAASFGYRNDDEFDRLRDALDTSYDRSIIDLAYQEGKQTATELRGTDDVDGADDIWTHLVTGASPTDPGDVDAEDDPGTPGPAGEFPTMLDRAALLDRAELLDGGADLGALGFPSLLGSPTDRSDAEE